MGAQLKIDGDETYGLAVELASLYGESIEAAVNRALREALRRGREARAGQDLSDEDIEKEIKEIRAITADIRKHLKHPLASSDHSWLYDDETGLPR